MKPGTDVKCQRQLAAAVIEVRSLMNRNTVGKLGPGSYAILIGAIALAMLAIIRGLAPLTWSPLFWGPQELILILLPTSMVMLAVAVILGAIALVRGATPMSRSDRDRDIDALEIVRRRYARGEMGQEDYRQMLADLQPRK